MSDHFAFCSACEQNLHDACDDLELPPAERGCCCGCQPVEVPDTLLGVPDDDDYDRQAAMGDTGGGHAPRR